MPVKPLKNILGYAGTLCLLAASVFSLHAGVPLDRIIRVQPIRISDGVTINNPNSIYFEAETKKIWAQAGIDIIFLPPVDWTNAAFFNISSGDISASALQTLSDLTGAGQNPDPNVINIWFCNLIDNSQNIQGYTLQSVPSPSLGFTVTKTAVAIPGTVFTHNGTDAIAHEIGHALGLNHSTLGATGQLNLMSSTTVPPKGLADIFPDGGKYDQMTAAQIEQARSCSYPTAFPAQPVQISPPRIVSSLDPNGKIKLSVDVFTNGNFRVLTRTAIPSLGANWANSDVISVPVINGHFDWVETNALEGFRFYQIKQE